MSKDKWQKATITETKGKQMYVCDTALGKWVRHADQMMKSKQKETFQGKLVNFANDNDLDFSCTINRAGNNQVQDAVPTSSQKQNETFVQNNQSEASPNVSVNESSSTQDIHQGSEGTFVVPKKITDRRTSNRNHKNPGWLNYNIFGGSNNN